MAPAPSQTRPQQTYMAQQGMSRGGPSGLAEVLDVLLDKGLVIDVFVRVSLIGIELLTIDARVVIASVDTYLRFAEAVNRLDLLQAGNSANLGDLVGGGSGGGSRALSSRGPRKESPKEEAEPASRDETKTPDDDVDEDEKPSDSATTDDDRTEATGDGDSPESEDAGSESSGDGSDDDDKGLLARIKERGQVF